MQILNLQILSFHLIPRTKYRQHLRVPPNSDVGKLFTSTTGSGAERKDQIEWRVKSLSFNQDHLDWRNFVLANYDN
jgi:hypothetical protein